MPEGKETLEAFAERETGSGSECGKWKLSVDYDGRCGLGRRSDVR